MKNADTLKNRPIGEISNENAGQITEFMNGLLANEYALFTKTLNYHWNITGPRFNSLHKFLEEAYNNLLETMDATAERIRVIGEVPISTVEKFNATMKLNERNGHDMSTSQMLGDLFESNLMIQSEIKDFLKKEDLMSADPGTEDFLVATLRDHEKLSWMLKSHLE